MSKVVGSGRTGISGSSDIVATMGDSEFGGLTSSTRTSRRDGRTQDAAKSTIGLAIFVMTFRVRGTIAVEFINSIQG
ncbi:NADH-ubiquinone oxidoreductase chain 4L, partial [Cucurbita argyrosperma subsp. argyrosperma]